MALFSIFRPAMHSGFNTMTSASRLGLGLKPAQLRTYYGKRTLPKAFQKPQPQAVARTRAALTPQPRLGLIVGGSIVAAVGLSAFTGQKTLNLDSSRSYAQPPPGINNANGPIIQEEPKSSVNVYQLSFGTICGLCAGVFIKKGAKFIAFLFGGIYILLQYLSSQRLVTVNWSAINNSYDKLVNSAAGPGGSKSVTRFGGSTAQRIWNRSTHFLMADFQPRATFMAGLLLGLRLG